MKKPVELSAKAIKNSGILPVKKDGYSTFVKNSSEDFKILVLTDTHFGRGFLSRKKDILAKNAIISIVECTKPDFIVINGDLIHPIFAISGSANNKKQAEYVSKLFESFEIPWAFVFGNHDEERHSKLKRPALADIYMQGKFCLFEKGPEGIDGVGNYVINVENPDGDIANSLIFMDSNMYTGKGFFSGFDHIHANQIEWYKQEIERLNKRYKKSTSDPVKSLMFFHIPIKEFKDAWFECWKGSADVEYHLGFVNETDNYFGYPKTIPNPIWDAVVEKGSTKGMFFGHDHLSSLSLEYKGVRMTYAMSIDYLAYVTHRIHKKYTQRGGTVVSLKGDGTFDVSHVPLLDVEKSLRGGK